MMYQTSISSKSRIIFIYTKDDFRIYQIYHSYLSKISFIFIKNINHIYQESSSYPKSKILTDVTFDQVFEYVHIRKVR
jgi:hypothetical protein